MSSAETKPACRLIPSGSTFHGKQGLGYLAGISAESVGPTGLCMHMVTIPPGTRANAHLHENHESAIYCLSGEAQMWFGESLIEYMTMRAGDYVYIPAGVPQLPGIPSPDVPFVGILARTDPNEQESVVLRPDLEPASPTGTMHEVGV